MAIETKLSIIIPVGSLVPESNEDRIKTLQAALKHFYKRVEVIVVEQSLDGKFYYLPHLEGCRKIEVSYPVFNKSWLINIGVKNSSYDHIVIADSDMFSREVIWDSLLEWMIQKDHKWAFAWNRLIYTTPSQKEEILKGRNMPGLTHTTPKPGYSEGGIVCVKKDFFYKIGMQNECFQDLGGYDNSNIARCKFLTNDYPMFPFLVYHMWHHQRRKSSRPTRRLNVKVLRKEQRRTQEAIDWLVAQDQGRMDAPLIDRKYFLDEKEE